MNRVEQAVCRIREKLPNSQGFVTLGCGCVVKNEELAESLGWKCPNILVTTTAVLSPELLALNKTFVAEFFVKDRKGYEVFDLKLAAEFCQVLRAREISSNDSANVEELPNEQQELERDGLTVFSVEPLDKRGFLKRMVKKSSLQTSRPIDCSKFENIDFLSEISDGYFCNVLRDVGAQSQEFETRTYRFGRNEETEEFVLKDFVGPSISLDVRNFPNDQQPLGAVIFSKHGEFSGALGFDGEQLVPYFIPDFAKEPESTEQVNNNLSATGTQEDEDKGIKEELVKTEDGSLSVNEDSASLKDELPAPKTELEFESNTGETLVKTEDEFMVKISVDHEEELHEDSLENKEMDIAEDSSMTHEARTEEVEGIVGDKDNNQAGTAENSSMALEVRTEEVEGIVGDKDNNQAGTAENSNMALEVRTEEVEGIVGDTDNNQAGIVEDSEMEFESRMEEAEGIVGDKDNDKVGIAEDSEMAFEARTEEAEGIVEETEGLDVEGSIEKDNREGVEGLDTEEDIVIDKQTIGVNIQGDDKVITEDKTDITENNEDPCSIEKIEEISSSEIISQEGEEEISKSTSEEIQESDREGLEEGKTEEISEESSETVKQAEGSELERVFEGNVESPPEGVEENLGNRAEENIADSGEEEKLEVTVENAEHVSDGEISIDTDIREESTEGNQPDIGEQIEIQCPDELQTQTEEIKDETEVTGEPISVEFEESSDIISCETADKNIDIEQTDVTENKDEMLAEESKEGMDADNMEPALDRNQEIDVKNIVDDIPEAEAVNVDADVEMHRNEEIGEIESAVDANNDSILSECEEKSTEFISDKKADEIQISDQFVDAEETLNENSTVNTEEPLVENNAVELVAAESKDSVVAESMDSVVAESRDSVGAESKDSVVAESKDSVVAESKDSVVAESKDSVAVESKDENQEIVNDDTVDEEHAPEKVDIIVENANECTEETKEYELEDEAPSSDIINQDNVDEVSVKQAEVETGVLAEDASKGTEEMKEDIAENMMAQELDSREAVLEEQSADVEQNPEEKTDASKKDETREILLEDSAPTVSEEPKNTEICQDKVEYSPHVDNPESMEVEKSRNVSPDGKTEHKVDIPLVDTGLPLLPDDLLSEAVTNNPKVLEDLARCLDTEYQYGGIPCWRDLGEVLAIPPEAYEHCSSFSEASPTEDLLMFLSATKPQLTVSDVKDSLRAIGRTDVVQILERCITRSIISNGSVVGSLVERDDTDLLGRVAIKLDPGYVRNWKALAVQLEIPRRVFRNFGSHQRHNSALLLFKYLPIFNPDLTIKSIREACEAIGRHDVVKTVASSGIPDDDPVKDILEDADLMDELTDYLNEEEVSNNWRQLAKELGVPDEKASIFEPAAKNSPTAMLLRSIEKCEPDVTVEELILALVCMKRQDVIEMLGRHFKREDIRLILEENNCLPPEPVKEENPEDLSSEEDC